MKKWENENWDLYKSNFLGGQPLVDLVDLLGVGWRGEIATRLGLVGEEGVTGGVGKGVT